MKNFVLITGASEGLGRAFARIAARRGHNVILCARSRSRLEALAEELAHDHGIEARVIVADLASEAECDRVWSEAVDGCRVEILVNNAGLGSNGSFDAPSGWDREKASIAVNVMAATRLMKLAVAHMLETSTPETTRGRILNVASIAGYMPGPQMAVYHAGKAYLLSLSEAVAHELRGTRVSVTALCPGATETNFFNDAEMHGALVTRLGTLPGADEVAEYGWQAAITGKTVAIPGLRNKLTVWSARIAPRRLTTAIAARLMSRPS